MWSAFYFELYFISHCCVSFDYCYWVIFARGFRVSIRGRVSADCNGSIHMLKGAAVCTLLFVLTISEDWK